MEPQTHAPDLRPSGHLFRFVSEIRNRFSLLLASTGSPDAMYSEHT